MPDTFYLYKKETGAFKQNIKLTNANDMAVQRAGYIGEQEIRFLCAAMLVDSCAYRLYINENIQQQLGLPIIGEHEVQLTDGSF